MIEIGCGNPYWLDPLSPDDLEKKNRERPRMAPPAEEIAPPAWDFEGRASYYSDSLEGRRTASGEVFRQNRLTAAHRTLPFGTVLEVESEATHRKVRVRVNDRGPFTGGFVIDLSRRAAHAIGVDRAANRRVRIRIVDQGDDEAE